MNGFTTTSLTPTTLDSHKRVNYSLGLVLGVDEFLQEQTYLMEGDRLHNRLLHGYGTICGLRVYERPGVSEPEILVEPGIAVDPQGQTINVPSLQCANLNDWLEQESNRQDVESSSGSPPGPVELYVVLCYRECRTDSVPIPGSPCRTEEDSTSPSRIADDFELRLVTMPPDQAEEELVNRFGRLLNLIEIDATATGFLNEEDLANLVRALPDGDPMSSLTSPPDSGLFLHPDTACEILQHAMHVWVTEVRGCDWNAEGQRCVRLAQLSFDTTEFGGNLRVAGPVTVDDETDRPLLLHSRLLHEWIACGRTSSGLELLALDDLIDVDAVPTAEGDIIVRRGLGWVSEPPPALVTDHDELGGLGDDDHPQYFNQVRGDARYALLGHAHPGGVTDHGGLTGLGDDDHPQYLLADGNRPLTGDWNAGAGNFRIGGLPTANAAGEAMPHGQPAENDLQGAYPNPRIRAIQGFRVMMRPGNILPQDRQQLTWNGARNRWEPAAPNHAVSDTMTLADTNTFGPLGPRQTVYSRPEVIPFPLNQSNQMPPVTVAVIKMEVGGEPITDDFPGPQQPSEELPNVTLTVYFVDFGGQPGFRVAATNLGLRPIQSLEVLWSAMQV